jgi:hypothetical protein
MPPYNHYITTLHSHAGITELWYLQIFLYLTNLDLTRVPNRNSFFLRSSVTCSDRLFHMLDAFMSCFALVPTGLQEAPPASEKVALDAARCVRQAMWARQGGCAQTRPSNMKSCSLPVKRARERGCTRGEASDGNHSRGRIFKQGERERPLSEFVSEWKSLMRQNRSWNEEDYTMEPTAVGQAVTTYQ